MRQLAKICGVLILLSQIAWATGMLLVEATPVDCEVLLDNILWGTAPAVIEGLPVGDISVIVRKSGFADQTHIVTIGNDELSSLKVELLQELEIKITSEPAAAVLFIDGLEVGVTPYEGALLSGPHVIELRKESLSAVRRQIVVAADGENSFKVKLALKGRSYLTITHPEGVRGDILVNGVRVGQVPANKLKVTAGLLDIKIYLQNQSIWSQVVTAQSGEYLSFVIKPDQVEQIKTAIVKFRVTVNAEGDIERVMVVTSSGFKDVDQRAMTELRARVDDELFILGSSDQRQVLLVDVAVESDAY